MRDVVKKRKASAVYFNKRKAESLAIGRCTKCNVRDSEKGPCSVCRERIKRQKKNSNIKLRREVLEAYGGAQCVCCGEKEDAFLTIDHIDNDGASHRKQVNGYIYLWYKKNNYPKGYQVLCMNCNFAKGKLGYCPHQHKEDKA